MFCGNASVNARKTDTFSGQDPSTLPGNPYLGPTGYFDGYLPWELMGAFPWPHLELLKMHLHRDDCREYYLRCPGSN